MEFLSDRLDKSIFDDPDELAFIEAHVGFDKLTLKEARDAMRNAKKVEKAQDVDLSGVIDELEEIIDDLKFTKDPKNSIIIWVNEHHKELEAKVLAEYAIEGLMIRAHVDRDCLVIMGKAAAPMDGVQKMVEQLSGFRAKNMITINA